MVRTKTAEMQHRLPAHRTELLRRVKIASMLENKLVQLISLINSPFEGEVPKRAAIVRLELGKIADELREDASLTVDQGEPAQIKNWRPLVRRYEAFCRGTQAFLRHFESMEIDIDNWSTSHWSHNQKYVSKFQSAGCDLREFIVTAEAILTEKDIAECRRKVRQEKLERAIAEWDAQSAMVDTAVERLRQHCLEVFASHMETLDELLGDRIPSEYRTDPVPKKVAAKLLGQPQEDSGVIWLNRCIEDGTIKCEQISRQRFVFDLRQFSPSAHPRLRRELPVSPDNSR